MKAKTFAPLSDRDAIWEGCVKNKLTDLNNHLFMQIERLSDEDMTDDRLEIELKRSEAMVSVADQIIRNASLHLQAAKIASDYGADPTLYLQSVGSGSKA